MVDNTDRITPIPRSGPEATPPAELATAEAAQILDDIRRSSILGASLQEAVQVEIAQKGSQCDPMYRFIRGGNTFVRIFYPDEIKRLLPGGILEEGDQAVAYISSRWHADMSQDQMGSITPLEAAVILKSPFQPELMGMMCAQGWELDMNAVEIALRRNGELSPHEQTSLEQQAGLKSMHMRYLRSLNADLQRLGVVSEVTQDNPFPRILRTTEFKLLGMISHLSNVSDPDVITLMQTLLSSPKTMAQNNGQPQLRMALAGEPRTGLLDLVNGKALHSGLRLSVEGDQTRELIIDTIVPDRRRTRKNRRETIVVGFSDEQKQELAARLDNYPDLQEIITVGYDPVGWILLAEPQKYADSGFLKLLSMARIMNGQATLRLLSTLDQDRTRIRTAGDNFREGLLGILYEDLRRREQHPQRPSMQDAVLWKVFMVNLADAATAEVLDTEDRDYLDTVAAAVEKVKMDAETYSGNEAYSITLARVAAYLPSEGNLESTKRRLKKFADKVNFNQIIKLVDEQASKLPRRQ